MSILSIDLGGSHIAVAIVRGGALLSESHWPTSASSLSGELSTIAATAHGCIAKSGVDARTLRGVAIGFCVVDGQTGEILSTLDKYPDALAMNLSAWAMREFALPLRIENDACMALLGECFAGSARGADDVVMVTLGTGIGGAVMIGGQLLRSRAGQAGCLGGHIPVNFHGRRCSCGAIGCAEAEASTVVLPLLCREHPRFMASSQVSSLLLLSRRSFGPLTRRTRLPVQF